MPQPRHSRLKQGELLNELREITSRERELVRTLHKHLHRAIHKTHKLDGDFVMSALTALTALGPRLAAVIAAWPADTATAVAAAVQAQRDADAADLQAVQNDLATARQDAANLEVSTQAAADDLTSKIAELEAKAGVVPPAPPVDPLALVTTALPDGVVGTAYTGSLSAVGGVAPYSFTSSPGVDNGVAVNAEGSVTGTPAAAADSTFSVTVSDSSTPPETASGSVTLHSA